MTSSDNTLPYPVRQAFGSLLPFIIDPTVTDVFVNGSQGLWVQRGSGAEQVAGWRLGSAELRSLAVGLIAVGGRHLDEVNPCVDVRLAHGIRVHAVLPPVSTTGPLLSIRIPRTQHSSFEELVANGLCDAATSHALHQAVAERKNLLITGPTGSGKTTLLAALLALASPLQRILTLEDVAELQIQHPHVVSLETRQPNVEGVGEVTLQRLIREALRMRPDRLVVGECRGPELRVLLNALNTGHDGGAGTLHASTLQDVPARLEALGATAGIAPADLARQVVSALDLVVHLEVHEGVRRIAQLGSFGLNEQGTLRMRRV